jgi:cobalt-zinc-cadmium efflux system outer membrane protein
MGQFNTVTVVVLSLAVTCGTMDSLCQAESPPVEQHQAERDHTVAAALKSGLRGPARSQADGRRVRRLPPAIHTAIQPVAYLEPSTGQQAIMPEVLPSQQLANLVKSELTLPDLEGLALQNNPAVGEAVSRVNAARGNWVQVGLPPNPELGYSGQQLGSHGQAEQQGVYIGQEFVTGKKLRLNRQIADWEVQRTERELDAVRLRVLTDVRTRYYHVLIAQRRRDVVADLVQISGQGVEAAQALFKGAEVSEADPLRARVEADTAGILLQNSINQHVEAWRHLTAVLGMPMLALGRLDGELRTDDLDSTWQEALRQVLSESPEMAGAIADVEAARWAVERAYAEVVPNISVQAVVQDDRGTGSNNGNLQVSIPLPFWNRNQGGIQRAQAEAAAATQAVDRLALDLQGRLAAAFQRYESARNQVEQYSRQDGILHNSKRTLELIRIGYKFDEFGVLDLLSAQRTYAQANLLYLDSLREFSVSAMEIRGLLLRDSLSK